MLTLALSAAEWLFPQGSGSPDEQHHYRPASLNSGCTLGLPGGIQNHLQQNSGDGTQTSVMS